MVWLSVNIAILPPHCNLDEQATWEFFRQLTGIKRRPEVMLLFTVSLSLRPSKHNPFEDLVSSPSTHSTHLQPSVFQLNALPHSYTQYLIIMKIPTSTSGIVVAGLALSGSTLAAPTPASPIPNSPSLNSLNSPNPGTDDVNSPRALQQAFFSGRSKLRTRRPNSYARKRDNSPASTSGNGQGSNVHAEGLGLLPPSLIGTLDGILGTVGDVLKEVPGVGPVIEPIVGGAGKTVTGILGRSEDPAAAPMKRSLAQLSERDTSIPDVINKSHAPRTVPHWMRRQADGTSGGTASAQGLNIVPSAVGDQINGALDGLAKTISDTVPGVGPTVGNLVTTIGSLVTSLVTRDEDGNPLLPRATTPQLPVDVTGLPESVYQQLPTGAISQSLPQGLPPVSAQAVGELIGPNGEVFEALPAPLGVVPQSLGGVTSGISSILGGVQSNAGGAVANIAGSVTQVPGKVTGAVSSLAQGGAHNPAQLAAVVSGLASPSMVTDSLGGLTGTVAFVPGVGNVVINALPQQIQGVAGNLPLGAATSQLGNAGQTVSGVAQTVTGAAGAAAQAVGGVAQTASGVVGSTPAGGAPNIVGGLAQTVQSTAGGPLGTVTGTVGGAAGTVGGVAGTVGGVAQTASNLLGGTPVGGVLQNSPVGGVAATAQGLLGGVIGTLPLPVIKNGGSGGSGNAGVFGILGGGGLDAADAGDAPSSTSTSTDSTVTPTPAPTPNPSADTAAWDGNDDGEDAEDDDSAPPQTSNPSLSITPAPSGTASASS